MATDKTTTPLYLRQPHQGQPLLRSLINIKEIRHRKARSLLCHKDKHIFVVFLHKIFFAGKGLKAFFVGH